jgi:tetratricopeptide (TPR) repeat protein
MTPSETAGSQIGRYKLLEQIGEGGMGTIWMAEQREPVKRRVALKIIKLGMDTKQVIARFEAERQALALMDHPHIAKVLDAGATETGRPYFVMEYIKGIPILEYCDQEKLDTRARLELFTSVCHAIQHAHQKGIIHRDIKPSNVLVTLHDGVPVPKVIDFGIAKATNSELTTKTLFTEHRQMIGTPAYMSPEQAEMSGLDIDTRSDVYSLGVLLYELLTGTTPFDMKALLESGFDELMRTIREVEPHKPSTRVSKLGDTGTRTAQQRRVDPQKLSLLLRGDVDWIVMKCLEKDRTRRYESANGLAADVRRHLNDEPVTAGAPGAVYRLRKFVKRNRAHVIAASAILTALLAAIVGTSWGWVEKSRARSVAIQRQLEDDKKSAVEKARLVRNAEGTGALLRQCEDALRAGDAAQARIALDAARKRSNEGGAEHPAERLARLSDDLALSTELDAIDQFRWTWTNNRFGDENVAAERTRAALVKFGAAPAAGRQPLDVSADDAAALVEGSAIRERIVLALDRLLWWADAEALRAVLGRVDADTFRDEFRDAVVARDAEKVRRLALDPAIAEQPPEFAAALCVSDVVPLARRRDLLRRAALRRPSDISLLMTLQSVLSDPRDPSPLDERMRWLQAAVAADPRNSAAYTNLGRVMTESGRVDQSGACYRIAVAVDPSNAIAHNNLGVYLKGKGALDEALACHRKAVELEPKCGFLIANLGEALAELGREDEAIDCYRKALELDPKDGYTCASLGDSLRRKGRIDEAIVSYRKAVELGERRGPVYGLLGDLLRQAGHPEEAIPFLRKGVELDPKLPWLHGKFGDALRAAGKSDEAIASYRKAIELDPNYDAYGTLGEVLRAKGQMDEAIACYRKAIELDPTRAEVHVALGFALHAEGHVDEAIACFRKAIEIDPDRAEAHHSLGVLLFNSGHPDQAVLSYRRAVELAPERAPYQLTLALTLQNLGQHDAALDGFRRTVELDPKDACASYNLGFELAAKQRWDEAIDWNRKALELDPNYAEAHCNLGNALQNKGRFAEALQCFRRGHELGSKRPGWSYPSAEWVRTAEMRAALEEKLPDLLAGRIEPADDAERLEYAQMCQAKHLDHAAVELYVDAFAADPKLAEDLGARHRYSAAVSAVLAAVGRGEDASQLDDRERARLRQQAIDWLRADLVLHARRLETGKPEDRAASQDALRKWQEDPDLACVRDAAALNLLPAKDRDGFGKLWPDVAALLR